MYSILQPVYWSNKTETFYYPSFTICTSFCHKKGEKVMKKTKWRMLPIGVMIIMRFWLTVPHLIMTSKSDFFNISDIYLTNMVCPETQQTRTSDISQRPMFCVIKPWCDGYAVMSMHNVQLYNHTAILINACELLTC